MATIANLIVEIGSKTKRLNSGLKKAMASVKSFSKKAAKAMLKFGSIVSGIVAGAGAGFLAFISSATEGIDVLAKTSQKLGIATEQLQKLQFQAKLAGVNTKTLDTSLQRMIRRVSEAAKGTGEAKNALKELGLNAKEIVKLSPDQQFTKIAAAFKKIGNQGDRVRLAMRLFDTEGVALVNVLNQDLAKTGKEFESLGVAINKSQAAAAESFQDSKTKLTELWNGFKNHLALALAGPAKKLVVWLTESIQKMGGMDILAGKVANSFMTFGKFMKNAFMVSKDTIMTLVPVLEKVWSLLRKIVGPLTKVLNAAKAGFVSTGTFIGESLAKGKLTGQFIKKIQRGEIAPDTKFEDYYQGLQGGKTPVQPPVGGKQVLEVSLSLDSGLLLDKIKYDEGLRALFQLEVDEALKKNRRNNARQVAR